MKLMLLLIGLALPCAVLAQSDTIYMRNQKIVAVVKEITPEAVKYSLPGEELLNTVYKNGVQKIVFKNGRIQEFTSTTYKKVSNVEAFEDVTTTSLDDEVKGLHKVIDVGVNAKGVTTLSNPEKIKAKAFQNLKIQAAMFGANVVFITNQQTQGNKYGGYYTVGSSTETNLTGVVYATDLPDIEQFKTLIGKKTEFKTIKYYRLYSSDSHFTIENYKKSFKLSNIINKDGIIFLEGDLDGQRSVHLFQVARFDNNTFSIAYKASGTTYNMVISL